MTARVAVVGAGITGLSAAHHLRRTTRELDVTVYESTSRPGGKLRTTSVGDLQLETGADAFLVRDPDALELCQQLGLDDELVEPAVQGVHIWADGRAHPLPPGLVLGAPARFGPLFGSDLISLRGALRAVLDLFVPRGSVVDRRSVADLVRRHYGHEVLERLVEPLLSGIYAGDPERLGAAAATPRLAEAVREHRSMARGLRDGQREPAADGSIFRSLRGGMSQLVERLVEEVDIETGVEIRTVREADDRYVLEPAAGAAIEADAVLLAVPAFAAADQLRALAPEASDALGEIPYVSVASVITVHEPGSVEVTGSGMLVAGGGAHVVKAVTYVSNKWPHLADDRIVLRSSVGRRGHQEPVGWDEDRLVDAVLDDLGELVGVEGRPAAVEVTRWERALPQYEPAHLDRLDRIERALAPHPRVRLAGAAYRGVGISACVRDARTVADRLVAEVTGRPG